MLDGLKIIGAESTLEPMDDLDDEFACTVLVEFTVQGTLLAQLFGVQQRVLQKALKESTAAHAFNQLQSIRAGRSIKSELQPIIKKAINEMAQDSFGRNATVIGYDFTDNTEYWDYHPDAQASTVTFAVEFDVLGRWDE